MALDQHQREHDGLATWSLDATLGIPLAGTTVNGTTVNGLQVVLTSFEVTQDQAP